MSDHQRPFKLVQLTRGGYKLSENGFFYDKQRIVGETIPWQCEQRGNCRGRIFTKVFEIVRRCNEYLHCPDVQKISCY